MTLLDFVRELRDAGLRPGTDRVVVAAQALIVLSDRPYWALRTTLCSQPLDIEIFDRVWCAEPEVSEADAKASSLTAHAAPGIVTAGQFDESGVEPKASGTGAGNLDALAVRDIRGLTPEELNEIDRLIALLAPAARRRPVMRRISSRAGRIDPVRTVRHMLRNGGEPTRIMHTRAALRPRQLLLLIDVSASMKEYTDPYLRLSHAMLRAGPDTTEVFTIGTRWTRLTPALRIRNVDASMRSVADTKSDWDSGTTLGPALREFLRRWSSRTSVRGAMIVIFSDGLEAGHADLLPHQVERLQRLGHLLLWVNPLLDGTRYKPLGAMKASLPFIDAHVSGRDLASLRKLAEVIAR